MPQGSDEECKIFSQFTAVIGTISHLRVSCYFMLLYQMRKYLPSVPGETEEIDQECDNCLFVTVRANLLSWQWLGSFSKVVRTLCPTKRMTGRFLGHVFNGIDSLLNAFAKLRKTTSFVVSVRPSVLVEQLGSSWRDFHAIWVFYENLSRKSKFH